MDMDEIEYEILADGTIKFTTDPVSGANHMSAEQFLKAVAQLAGGETTRTKRKESTHAHKHAHHEHQHG